MTIEKYKSNTRIAHVSTAHHPLDKRLFIREARMLANRGWNVTSIGVADERLEQNIDGVDIVVVAKGKTRVDRFRRVWQQVRQEVLDRNFDIVHFHDPDLLLAAPSWRHAGIATVYDVHEDLPRQIMHKGWLPALSRKPLGIFAEFVERLLATTVLQGIVPATSTIGSRFPESKTRVVMNLPDLSLFNVDQLPLSQRNKQIVYVGVLSEERGLFEFIESAGKLSNEGYTFVLAGYFVNQAVEDRARATQGWELIDFRGFLDVTELVDLLINSQIGCVTLHPIVNYIDSEPVKLFEYLAAGLAVIASDNQSWTRHVRENECGVLVDPRDADQVAAGLKELIELSKNSAAEFDELGQRGQKYVTESMSLASEIDGLELLYSQILEAAS